MSKRGMTPKQAEMLRIQKGVGKGTKLRKMRVAKELSQSELAEQSGIPIQTLRRYEQNIQPINNAKLKTICSLCLTLSCNVEDILEDETLIERYNKCK